MVIQLIKYNYTYIEYKTRECLFSFLTLDSSHQSVNITTHVKTLIEFHLITNHRTLIAFFALSTEKYSASCFKDIFRHR